MALKLLQHLHTAAYGVAAETEFHAWVQFEKGGESYLFETMLSPSSAAVRPLKDVKDDYLPWYGTDVAGNGFTFLHHFRTVLREGA